MNTKGFQALNLVGPTRKNLVFSLLTLLSLNIKLCITTGREVYDTINEEPEDEQIPPGFYSNSKRQACLKR